MEVSAPCSGEMAKRLASVMAARIGQLSPLPKFEATKPGCSALAVTSVPTSRRASSYVNMMLASFDSPYTRRPR